MQDQAPKLAILIPCYNEQDVLPHTLEILLMLLKKLCANNTIAANSFLYCVNDGSRDLTWQIISEKHKSDIQVKGLKLSKNVGHQNALYAGMMQLKNKVDCVVTIDADLQDDPNAIIDMVAQFKKGNDLVYGIRVSRTKDSFFKRFSAKLFYKFIHQSNHDVLVNHADFRLMSNRAIIALSQFKERNLFLRGIIPLIGYHSSYVYYDRAKREHGKTKYPLAKMIALAWEGVASFSHAPLNCIFAIGIISFVSSIFVLVWTIICKLQHLTVPGWASIMIPLCFMGGIQLLSVGVIGEYIAKIYIEVKRRPRYIKDEELI